MSVITDGLKDLIRNLFMGLMRREVDEEALNFYHNKLITKVMSVEEFIHTLLESEEFQNSKRAHRDPFINWVPPGHFYSPIPSMEDIKSKEEKLFNYNGELPGINLNPENQVKLLSTFAKFYNELPFTEVKSGSNRYYNRNDFFSYSDAIILYSMIRHLNPCNIIEVGSGFSSAVILDTNELFFNNSISCRFIEPYPDRLLSLIRNNESALLIREKLENIELSFFEDLCENDILFIDSSHVSKIGSDVNYLFFEIIPRLKQGVYIHIHDIFYPFEYPPEWIYEGRCWNEAYILKTFLQFNDSFEIVFWNDYMIKLQGDNLEIQLPQFSKKPGSSIWIRKTK